MFIESRIPLLAVALAGFCSIACEDDAISRARPDVGALPTDGGISGPLPLQVGMSFTYRGILTAREDQAVERNSVYDLTLTITAIDEDAGTLAYSATGANTLADDWTEPFDFSAWVGRVGPTLRDDEVLAARTVTVGLLDAPGAPERSNPKVLPAAGPFFFDVRAIDQLRADFSQAFAAGQPTVTDPSQANGRWRFSFTIEDPTIITYNLQRRQMVLEYDARGFLVRMTETLGQIDNPPSGDFRLELQAGP